MKHTYPQLIHTAFGVCALSLAFAFTSIAQASEITPDRVIELVNQDRIEQGVSILHSNVALMRAAQAKADDMAKNEYFAHTSPSGVTPWYWIQKSGYDYRSAGENLAIRFIDAETQEKAWMESIKHRENILNSKYQDVGVAVKHTVQNEKDTIIVVQMFGLSTSAVLSVTQTRTDVSPHIASANKLIPSSLEQKQPVSIAGTARTDTFLVWNSKYFFVMAILFTVL